MGEESTKSIAVYLRVSSKEQAMFGFGLEAQYEKISKYLEVYDIPSDHVKIYKDDGFSAKNLNRPQLKIMLNEYVRGSKWSLSTNWIVYLEVLWILIIY